MNTESLPVAEGVVDSQAMFAVTASLPGQLRVAADQAKNMADLPKLEAISCVVVLGMGGSGVAGEILRAIGADSLPVPLVLVDGYELPGFVGRGTLCFAISFSGNTEETLAAADEAHRRGALLIAITGGGALRAFAEDLSVPCYALPNTIPQPRAGLGAMVAPLLVSCAEIGLIAPIDREIDAAVAQMEWRQTELIEKSGGISGEVALRLGRSFPLIYGGDGIGAVAARRWKTQVNENAKAPAFYSVQPELCHNEVCGFGQSGDVTRQLITLVLLRTDFEHPRLDARFRLTAEYLREAVADVVELTALGDGPLAQLFDLIYVGDFVSLHLATKEGIDPGPVPILVDLKTALSRLEP